MKQKNITVAIAGNPNSGKTTIFNNLTGSRQKVGNWSGVTVEKKQGTVHFQGYEIKVVDLPGIYSLTPYSIEEIIARDFIIDEKPDIVIDIIDSSNLERNLYLAVQLVELGVKLILVLNMIDEATSKGVVIDQQKMGSLFGTPVVATIGSRNIGMDKLLAEVVKVAEDKEPVSRHIHLPYGEEVEEEIRKLQARIWEFPELTSRYSTRWLSVKLLENDSEIMTMLENADSKYAPVLRQSKRSSFHLHDIFEEEPGNFLGERRYGFIHGLLREAVKMPKESGLTLSQKIDKVMTNRILGFPLFLLLMWAMFQLTFTVGQYPAGWIDEGVMWLGKQLSQFLPSGTIKNLITDGIIGGAGGIIVFLPNIMILFLCISFFEDTGYMARTAFIMDKVMHTLGLHGKSFIPLLMGFGCNVPAIMATRTLENRKDRILTILIIPLMSCSARLPVYILLTGAFFPQNAGNVIFSLYLLGVVLSVISGQIFQRILLKLDAAPFVLELPPYRMPTLKSTMIHMWEKGVIFLKKMGTVILAGSMLIWFLSSFPQPVSNSHMTKAEIMEQTYIGRLGKFLSPVVKPLGFDWRGGVALITGFFAKEIVVSTYGVLYQVGEKEEESEGLRSALQHSGMSPLVAYAFMVFTLIYTPCLGTVAAIRRETGSWGWTFFSVGYSITLAWMMAFLIQQGGKLLGTL